MSVVEHQTEWQPEQQQAGLGLGKGQIFYSALKQALIKFNPRYLWDQPVLLVLEIAALLSLLVTLVAPEAQLGGSPAVAWQLTFWLWATLLFANFSEALAEGRGKARADSLRDGMANLLATRCIDGGETTEVVAATALRKGDIVLVKAGEMIPADGEVIEGIAAVNEAAITGESAPVIRESGGDRCAVTGNTVVVSDWIRIQVTVEQGDSTLDRMIALVEGTKRQKTPNEIALNGLLIGLTLILLVVVLTLPVFASMVGGHLPLLFLIALVITLIPTTIGGLLSAIGIAGMDRLIRCNVVAKSGKAVEAAGDVQTLLLDKTGTITFGNRMADEFISAPGVEKQYLAEVACLTSLSDETPEGKSIVELAQSAYGLSGALPKGAEFVPFTAETRSSGIDFSGRKLRKGAVDAMASWVGLTNETLPAELKQAVNGIAQSGGTPLLVAEQGRLLGAIHLKDVIKPGIRERFAELRQMGIRTVMVTGDNPLTAAVIAAESGVDDFIAEATPEKKLNYIRQEQSGGRMVAMCGDGANDAPALAQADVGVAMNDGTQAAREAANMVDLDSDPTKLIDVVGVGKQLLATRGALTTFSIANDVAKYFALLPALFIGIYPSLAVLNVMHLHSASSAMLSAIIYNALIILALVPLALRGVKVRQMNTARFLRHNLVIYGLGGSLHPSSGSSYWICCWSPWAGLRTPFRFDNRVPE